MRSRLAAPLLAIGLFVSPLSAQAPAGPYDPKADAARDLAAAGARAGASGRNVLAIVGGNWCVWCRALEKLVAEDPELSAALAAGYETVHVNFSKENRNEAVLAKMGRPDKQGFPVLVVLSPKLAVLHVQETGSLELADKTVKGHDRAKVLAFLKAWSPKNG